MTKIYLAKYVPDQARWEPRNVGVIITNGDRAVARFIGEKVGGGVDGRRVRHAIGAPAPIYREWVQFWRRMITEHADFDNLPARPGADFFLTEAGEVWAAAPDRPISAQLTDFYGRLVQREAEPGEAELRQQVEDVITGSHLAARVEIRRDVVVAGTEVEGNEQVKFAYGFQNGHMVYGHRVPLGIETLVHDALYRYIAVGKRVPKVSFVRVGAGESRSHLTSLRAYSTVIDVGKSDAADRLEAALLAS